MRVLLVVCISSFIVFRIIPQSNKRFGESKTVRYGENAWNRQE